MQSSIFVLGSFVGGLALLVVAAAEREVTAGVERLSHYQFSHHTALDADPNLKLVSARSPYMRSER